MENAPVLLLHWEAFYPYTNLQAALEKDLLPKDFPSNQLQIALPHDYLKQALTALSVKGYSFGINDMLNATPQTFTGSIATNAIQASKASFVLLGKAFQRQALQESPATLKDKLHAALELKMPLFFCFGESKTEAEAGQTNDVILSQLKTAFEGILPEQLSHIQFVYDTPSTLLDMEDIQKIDRDQAYQICHQQYVALWGEDIAKTLKTLCALPCHSPIPETFFDNSPFAGVYFKMIDSDLDWLASSLKNIKPIIETVSKTPDIAMTPTTPSTLVESPPPPVDPSELSEETPKKRAPRKSKPSPTDLET